MSRGTFDWASKGYLQSLPKPLFTIVATSEEQLPGISASLVLCKAMLTVLNMSHWILQNLWAQSLVVTNFFAKVGRNCKAVRIHLEIVQSK